MILRKRPIGNVLPLVAGKACPRCTLMTVRWPTPLWLGLVQHLLPRHLSYRYCSVCDHSRVHLY
jgi:hypothetical protein